jgi:hypothetical protein
MRFESGNVLQVQAQRGLAQHNLSSAASGLFHVDIIQQAALSIYER